MHTVSIGLLLLAVTAITTGVVRKLRIPLPLLQIGAGVLLAWPAGLHVELEPETFLLVFIPPLLFIDGWRIPKGDFRRFRRTILTLAFGLVVATVIAIGLLIEACIPSIPPFVAFALASALSPTDAVAVAGISGRTAVPSKLMHVLQGEALMNDASGLVCLRVAIAAIATGTFSWSRAGGSLAVVALGGIVVGAAIAWLFSRLQRLVFGNRDDAPEGRILLVVTLPYAAYIVAEHVHFSGILAAAAAGMILPRLGLFDVGERVARRQTMTVLSAFELGLNGLVFVLLGLQLPAIVRAAPDVVVHGRLGSWPALAGTILATAVGLFVVRLAWIWLTLPFTLPRNANRTTRTRLPFRILLATAFGGARGAVSLAAALTLPIAVVTPDGPYPAREVGVCIAAAVILVSLVSASIGLPLSLRGIQVDPVDDAAERTSVRTALVEAAIAAVESARDKAEDAETMTEAARLVLESYRSRALDDHSESAKRQQSMRALWLIGIAAERHHLEELFRRHAVEDVTYRDTLRELDAIEEAIAKPAAGHH